MRSSLPDTRRPRAVVIGLDCITGLQTARILARRKVPVIGIASNPRHYCCRTKVCEKILHANTSDDDFLDLLEAIGPELNHKAVLFPCTDMSVLRLSRSRRRVADRYHMALPDPDVLEILIDKTRFHAFARKAGLPVPATRFLYDRADAVEAARTLAFPCILKPPMKTPRWQQNTTAKVYKVSTAAELLDLYDRCRAWAECLMVQEWIEGTDADLYSCNCYFNTERRPVATFVARKLRQWPPQTGTSCLGEECRNDAVLDETIRLFQSVGYHGLGYVEMKRDARSGRHFIIEPNVGRPTGRSAIAETGGVELLYAMYCDLVGLPPPANLQQTYRGVKWICWRRDLQSALYYWRRGELSLADYWRSRRGRKAFAVHSWTDPAPFWTDLWNCARLLITRPKPPRRAPRDASRGYEVRL